VTGGPGRHQKRTTDMARNQPVKGPPVAP